MVKKCFFHVATGNTSRIYKISTLFEEISFFNPSSHLNDEKIKD